jgi:rhamnosyltransferase
VTSTQVTVALPVLDGERWLDETLGAVRAQRLDPEIELLIADSGSRDRSREIAAKYGARVIDLEPGSFSHGGTRNLLMSEAQGEHVAFLTQDSLPAEERWLARLLGAFELADDVALAHGPYLPRSDASHMVRREFEEFFGSFSPNRRPRLFRLDGDLPSHPGPLTFFTDANGCVARWAWERVPFREAPYAEDQLLARDMLAAGFAKAYVPDAAVVHSHSYAPLAQFRRFFDEFRGLREVHGHVEQWGVRSAVRRVRSQVAADRAWLRRHAASERALQRATLESAVFHASRTVAAALGTHADSLPRKARRALSLENRDTFEPAR